jgi:SSS family solute:Na+ symporter
MGDRLTGFMNDTDKIYYIFIGLYVVGMILVGIGHALRIRTALDYLAAGREVGFFRTMGTVVATLCGAAAFIGFVGQGYASGINGIFLWVLPALFFALIFALCFGHRLRTRSGALHDLSQPRELHDQGR